MSASDDLGVFERRGDHIDVRFERHFPRPVETVWSALTDPTRLSDWMGAAHVEPRVGGRIDLMLGGRHAMTGRILVWDAPHVLDPREDRLQVRQPRLRRRVVRVGDPALLADHLADRKSVV